MRRRKNSEAACCDGFQDQVALASFRYRSEPVTPIIDARRLSQSQDGKLEQLQVAAQN